jgi:hypothetical protein
MSVSLLPSEPDDRPFWGGRGTGEWLGEDRVTEVDSDTGEYPIKTSPDCILLACTGNATMAKPQTRPTHDTYVYEDEDQGSTDARQKATARKTCGTVVCEVMADSSFGSVSEIGWRFGGGDKLGLKRKGCLLSLGSPAYSFRMQSEQRCSRSRGITEISPQPQ